jgi:hypothetical protein
VGIPRRLGGRPYDLGVACATARRTPGPTAGAGKTPTTPPAPAASVHGNGKRRGCGTWEMEFGLPQLSKPSV